MAATRLTQAERREQTRRALLDAARREFGARGFGAATLDDIAAAAGVTRGALYYNFPGGKEDLFLELLDERLQERAEALREPFTGPVDARRLAEQARQAANDAQAAVAANREWQLLAFELALHAARDPGFGARWMEQEATIRDAIEAVIREGAAELDGEPPIAPADLAVALNALGIGLALDVLVDPANVRDGLFGDVASLLVRGMVAEIHDRKTQTKGGRK